MSHHVYIFCSDKARNGKTLLARLFLGHLTLTPDAPYRILDTSFPGGGLSRYYPNNSEIVDFSKTGGHVRLFDQILENPSQDYLIDLQSEHLIKFFEIFNDIEFATGLAMKDMHAVVYYVVDADESSYEMAVNIYSTNRQIEFLPVYNHLISPEFDLKMISRSAGDVEPLREVELPSFSPDLLGFMNEHDFDLSKFILGSLRHDDISINDELLDVLKRIYEARAPDKRGNVHLL